ALGGEDLQEPAPAPHQLGDGELRRAQVDGGRDALDHGLTIWGRGALEQPIDAAGRDARRVLVRDPGRLADRLGERPERDAVAIRQAAAADEACLALGPGGELADEP